MQSPHLYANYKIVACHILSRDLRMHVKFHMKLQNVSLKFKMDLNISIWSQTNEESRTKLINYAWKKVCINIIPYNESSKW